MKPIPRWKILSTWTKLQLKQELHTSRELELNHSFDEPERADPQFYQCVCSEAIVGIEKSEVHSKNSEFERAWEYVKGYRFSDPIQVEAFYSEEQSLKGRCLVLEIKALALNFLGSVKITDVYESETIERVRRGFRYDTLEGHPENGSEWFVLEKNRRTGEIKFRISSSVRSGTFPNWWTQFGYRLVGKFYRDRWHTQSYRRLQKLLGSCVGSPVFISNTGCTVGFDAQTGLPPAD